MSRTTDSIRNVVLVGHSGAGKTSLLEAMLLRAGAISRAGRVEDGTTVGDTEPEEIRRKLSLSLAIAPLEWKDAERSYRVNVIDTPGYPDFDGEVEAGLAVADLAVFVVSAVSGVEVQTEVLWRRCVELGIPRMVFVSKEDKERADFHDVLGQLTRAFGAGFVPLELPLGEESRLHGVADVLSETAIEYEPSGAHRTEPLPAEIEAEEHQLHDRLVEEIVAGDDDQLERYLSGEALSVEELEKTLAKEVLKSEEFPVLCGSSITGVGVDRLLDFICQIGPSPADRAAFVEAAGDLVEVRADAAAQPLLFVFKTVSDPFVGQLSYFKVLSGVLRADSHLTNSTTGADERLHGLFTVQGKEQKPVTELVAGELGAVAKLANTHTGDTLAPKGTPVKVPRVALPPAVHPVAIKPKTQADDDKLGAALQRLQAEDPGLVVERREETRQTVLCGAGDTHVAVALERLARKFGVNVVTENVKVAYRETVVGNAEAEGKVKKQSGGHGQYAVVNLKVAPTERGHGLEFVDAVVGGAIPRNYIPAVHKGVEEAMSVGGVHGFPVVDVRVECYDGKFHSVDSSEMAFKTAAASGLREAMAKAGVAVLEPISHLAVDVPSSSQGDVMGDITARRGRVLGSSALEDGYQRIMAHVPTAELLRYAVELRSLTGGRGRFSTAHDHYDVLPSTLLATAKASLEAEKS